MQLVFDILYLGNVCGLGNALHGAVGGSVWLVWLSLPMRVIRVLCKKMAFASLASSVRSLGADLPSPWIMFLIIPLRRMIPVSKLYLVTLGRLKVLKSKLIYLTKTSIWGRGSSLVLKASPPRSLTINGYICRVWFKGQPLVCNLCGVQGHKSSACSNRDKCRRCGEMGHFVRACPRTFKDPNEDDNRMSATVCLKMILAMKTLTKWWCFLRLPWSWSWWSCF